MTFTECQKNERIDIMLKGIPNIISPELLKILAEMYIYSSECFTPEGYVKLNDYLEYNVKDIEVERRKE